MDMLKQFDSANGAYARAQNMYKEEAGKNIDPEVLGNIQFRYGWSLIRSRKDINYGIQQLENANKNLPENVDLKIKLSQIYLQEKQEVKKAIEIIDSATTLEPDNVDALLLKGKLLIKEKMSKEAIEVVEKALLL